MSRQKYDRCLAVHLLFNHTEVQAERKAGTDASGWGIFVSSTFKCGRFLPRTALKYACVCVSIVESISWMMRVLQFLWQRKKQPRGCVTWKLAARSAAAAAALNSEFVGVFEEILMRAGVNRACMQSLFLQLVDATDHLSGHCATSQLWPARTWLRKLEDCEATGGRDTQSSSARGRN